LLFYPAYRHTFLAQFADFSRPGTLLAGFMRRFPTRVVALTYARSFCFPIVVQLHLWPNVSTFIEIASIVEKRLDRMRRIIWLKH